MTTTAVCITGLERSYAEIASNIDRVILRVAPRARFFGVRPKGSWDHVTLSFDGLAHQTRCESPAKNYLYPPRAWSAFIQELCDLKVCEDIISKYEFRKRMQFSAVIRLRLDLFWEAPVHFPTRFHDTDVFVPQMSHCNGVCDKFAFGGRSGMREYLTRIRWVNLTTPKRRINSEMFLARTRHISFQIRRDWMFCKFGSNISKFHAWSECTRRIRAHVRCDRLLCDWCGRGCRCATANCTENMLTQHLCLRTSTRAHGQRVVQEQMLLSYDD